MRKIELHHVEHVAFYFAQKWMSYNEPIPPYETRFKNALESCLATPFMGYYQGLAEKGAILFYLLVKNHPFKNGNKRIAVMSLLTFLALNDRWLTVTDIQIYKMAKEVAESSPDQKDMKIGSVKYFIERNLVKP